MIFQFFMSCLSLLVFAVPEEKVLSQMIDSLNDRDFYQVSFFTTTNGLSKKSISEGKRVRIYYARYGQERGGKGSLVIAPGRTESSLKYIEVAQDLISSGFSPVYVIDHRGQGFSTLVSSSPLPDSQMGHVEDFEHYVQDFSQFVNEVVLYDQTVDKQRLFLLSNSMGGAIVMRYFQENPANPFKRSVLSGSMFKIIGGGLLSTIKATAVCEAPALASNFVDLKCYDYTPGESAIVWAEQKKQMPNGQMIRVRDFHGEDPSYARNLTSSAMRFYLNDYIWNQWPTTQVGGPTIKWSEQALKATAKLRSNKEVAKVKNKMLLLIASRDFRADEDAQIRLCQKLHGNCRFIKYDSYHEILMEKDYIRNRAFSDIVNYFSM